MSPPPGGLAALAGWNLPQLRGAVSTLDVLAGRFVTWRSRLGSLTLQLAAPDVWAGDTARAGHGALTDLHVVATVVDTALDGSLAQFTRVVTEAAAAHELALQALAIADAGGVTLDGAGRSVAGTVTPHPAMPPDHLLAAQAMAGVRSEALAADAFAAAAAAGRAAAAAGDELAGLGVDGGGVPVDFTDLPNELGPMPPFLSSRSPDEVAAWWAALSPAQRLVALALAPATMGSLDGLPAWARDRANRNLLDEVVARPVWPAAPGTSNDNDATAYGTALAVAAEIEAHERAGQPVQLWQFEPGGGLVALAVGDLDTAEAVSVLVSGKGTDPAGDLRARAGDARDVNQAARAAAPGLAVASLVWMGYRAPQSLPSAALKAAARPGGPALDRALDGLAATRASTGGSSVRTTVVAHSYGTLVVDVAADEPGDLATDAVVLLGSPGVWEWSAHGLEAPEVYDAQSGSDSIPPFWHGMPSEFLWGSQTLPTEEGQGHSEYLDRDRPTLAAIGEVVAGTR